MLPANERELERRTRELHALTEVAKTLTAALDLPALLGAAADLLFNVQAVSLGFELLYPVHYGSPAFPLAGAMLRRRRQASPKRPVLLWASRRLIPTGS